MYYIIAYSKSRKYQNIYVCIHVCMCYFPSRVIMNIDRFFEKSLIQSCIFNYCLVWPTAASRLDLG
jgi:hypothetical protein